MESPFEIDQAAIKAICLRYGVQKLSLFGSAIHGDFGPDSDVDLLVEFQPDQQVGYFRLTELQLALEDVIGRKVDLRTPGELSRYFREQVMQEAVIQYAA